VQEGAETFDYLMNGEANGVRWFTPPALFNKPSTKMGLKSVFDKCGVLGSLARYSGWLGFNERDMQQYYHVEGEHQLVYNYMDRIAAGLTIEYTYDTGEVETFHAATYTQGMAKQYRNGEDKLTWHAGARLLGGGCFLGAWHEWVCALFGSVLCETRTRSPFLNLSTRSVVSQTNWLTLNTPA
jgi:hypothetical protein